MAIGDSFLDRSVYDLVPGLLEFLGELVEALLCAFWALSNDSDDAVGRGQTVVVGFAGEEEVGGWLRGVEDDVDEEGGGEVFGAVEDGDALGELRFLILC